MRRSALWRNRLPLLLYRILRRRRRRTSFLNDVTCGRTRRIARFGMEAAERDGSDAVDGGRSHLTGDHRQPPGTEPCGFLRRKLQRHATNTHRRVVSRAV